MRYTADSSSNVGEVRKQLAGDFARHLKEVIKKIRAAKDAVATQEYSTATQYNSQSELGEPSQPETNHRIVEIVSDKISIREYPESIPHS
jgi:hypothetical protein